MVGHGSCITGHGSVFVWVSGSWVTPCDPLFTLGITGPGGSLISTTALFLFFFRWQGDQPLPWSRSHNLEMRACAL